MPPFRFRGKELSEIIHANWINAGSGGSTEYNITHSDFGAVGDGVTDNTTAIQAALDAINSAGGGKCYIPQGDFLTGSLNVYSNTEIVGSGWASRLLAKPEAVVAGPYTITAVDVNYGSVAGAIRLTVSGTPWSSNQHVEKRLLLATGSASGEYGRISANTASTIVYNRYPTTQTNPAIGDTFNITSAPKWLVSVNSGSGGTSDVADNEKNITFRKFAMRGTSDTDGFYEHYHLLNLNAVSDVLVEEMKFEGFRSDAIYIGSGNDAGIERHNERVTIRKSFFDGINKASRNPISIIDGYDITIDNNYFTRSGFPGMPACIDAEPDANSFAVMRKIRITNNTMIDCPDIAAVGLLLRPQSTVDLPQNDFVIENNYVDGCLRGYTVSGEAVSGGATEATPSYDVTIKGGTVKNCTDPFYVDAIKGMVMEGVGYEDIDNSAYLGYNIGYLLRDVTLKDNAFRRVATAQTNAINIGSFDNLDLDGNEFEDVGNSTGSGGRAYYFANANTGTRLKHHNNVYRTPNDKTTDVFQQDAAYTLSQITSEDRNNRVEFTPDTPLFLYGNGRTYSLLDYGGVADGMTDNGPMLQTAFDDVPVGSTLIIPEGKFKVSSQAICNRPINVIGQGHSSVLWVEGNTYPRTVDEGPMIQFGYPYSGYSGEPARGVFRSHIGNFAVRGTADVNPDYALGFLHTMHSVIENVYCDANAWRASTCFAGLNGTSVKNLQCDLGGGLADFSVEDEYVNAHPTAIGAIYASPGNVYYLADITFSGVNFPTDGLSRKRYQITGTGAINTYRVYGNTSTVVTVIVKAYGGGASWPNGTPTTGGSTFRVYDSTSGKSGDECMVVLLDLDAAPFSGQPGGWTTGMDPHNANDFHVILRGNGNSGSGLLVEKQTAGGNNTFRGLIEGFADSGSAWATAYGESKYCAKIVGCQGWALTDLHVENAGNGTTDPCIKIADGSGASCKYYTLGPRLGCDQKIKVSGGGLFSMLGVRTTYLELPTGVVEGTYWQRNLATEVGAINYV